MMNTLKDITSRKDIDDVLMIFYKKAIRDQKIGSFFTEVARIDLESHLPILGDFWEQQLFFTGGYKKNVLKIHQHLHHQKSMTKIHFETWLLLFNQSLDENFKGARTDLMKTRALSIATLIQMKIN